MPTVQPSQRPIDESVEIVQHALKSRFAYVTKARANVWLTAGITMFVAGLGGSILLTAYQNALVNIPAAALDGAFLTAGPSIEGPTQVTQGQDNGFVFDAPGAGATAIRYAIDWGDGSPVADTVSTAASKLNLTHSYAQIGKFTITGKAAFASSEQFSAPATHAIIVTDLRGLSAPADLVALALDASSPASRRVAAGQTDAVFAAIKAAASEQSDITLKSLLISVKTVASANAAGSGATIFNAAGSNVVAPQANFSQIKIYSGDTLLGSASVDALSGQVRISLGAGITIPAGSATVLLIKADVRPDAAGGESVLGVAGLTTQPDTAVSALPVYGNTMTIAAGAQ